MVDINADEGLLLFGNIAKNAISKGVDADLACDIAIKCVMDKRPWSNHTQSYGMSYELKLLARAYVEKEGANDHLLLPLLISGDPMPVLKVLLRQFSDGGKYQNSPFEPWLDNFAGSSTCIADYQGKPALVELHRLINNDDL